MSRFVTFTGQQEASNTHQEREECSICFEEITSSRNAVCPFVCNRHVICRACDRQLILRHENRCPTCRQPRRQRTNNAIHAIGINFSASAGNTHFPFPYDSQPPLQQPHNANYIQIFDEQTNNILLSLVDPTAHPLPTSRQRIERIERTNRANRADRADRADRANRGRSVERGSNHARDRSPIDYEA